MNASVKLRGSTRFDELSWVALLWKAEGWRELTHKLTATPNLLLAEELNLSVFTLFLVSIFN